MLKRKGKKGGAMIAHESEEMYLETIFLLLERRASVRSVDLVEELGYAKSSVSRAVNLLQSRGYLLVAPNGDFSLTEEGKQKAAGVYERHEVITKLLVGMGVGRELAETDACRIEHVLSQESFMKIKEYTEKIF